MEYLKLFYQEQLVTSGTGADPTFSGLDTTKFWFPFTECRGNGAGCDANFGNGFFGTTAISSEGTNASRYW